MSKIDGGFDSTILTPSLTIDTGGMTLSPSRESLATDLSLMSLSSLGSDMGKIRYSNMKNGDDASKEDLTPLRRSPRMLEGGIGGWASSTRSSRGSRNSLLQVPSEHHSGTWKTPHKDVLFEEENDVIRNCGALCSVLGLMKSFSTSDITNLGNIDADSLKPSVSDVGLSIWNKWELSCNKLDYASRSCSTWVAVGDMSSTSQLPSPQAQHGSLGETPVITAADLIRSVNKKVRQMYIRRRVLSTYRALERLSHSQLNISSTSDSSEIPTIPQVQISSELDRSLRNELCFSNVGFHGATKTLSLSVKDIEKQKGKPLTKYERNMMIFNWLHTLDENGFDTLS